MKIVTKKQMRLDELIKHVWENPVREKMIFHGSHDQRVVFDDVGNFYPSGYAFSDDSLFTVEVEEDVTEYTVFDNLLIVGHVFGNPFSEVVSKISISEVITNDIGTNYSTEAIYFLDNKYRTTLVWANGYGIPSEGVLEAG